MNGQQLLLLLPVLIKRRSSSGHTAPSCMQYTLISHRPRTTRRTRVPVTLAHRVGGSCVMGHAVGRVPSTRLTAPRTLHPRVFRYARHNHTAMMRPPHLLRTGGTLTTC